MGPSTTLNPKNGGQNSHVRTSGGHVEAVRVLLGARADVHSSNKSGHTSLMIASQRGQVPKGLGFGDESLGVWD